MFRISSQIQLLLGLALLFVFYGLIDRFPTLFAEIAQNHKLIAFFGYKWIFSFLITIFIMICYIVFVAFYRISHRDTEINTIQRTAISYLQVVAALTFVALLSIYYVENIQSVIYIIYGFFMFSGIVAGSANFMIDRRLELLSRNGDRQNGQNNGASNFWERLFGNSPMTNQRDDRYSDFTPGQNNQKSQDNRYETTPFSNDQYQDSNNRNPTFDNGGGIEGERRVEGGLSISPSFSEDPGYGDDDYDVVVVEDGVERQDEASIRSRFQNNFLFSAKILISDSSIIDSFKV